MIFATVIFTLALVTWPCVHSRERPCPVITGPCPGGSEGYSIGNGQFHCCPEGTLNVLRDRCICHSRGVVSCPILTLPCPGGRDSFNIGDGRYFCCPEGTMIDLRDGCQCYSRPIGLSECLVGEDNCTQSTSRAEYDGEIYCCEGHNPLQTSTVHRDGEWITRCHCLNNNIGSNEYPSNPPRYYRRRRISDTVGRSVADALAIADAAVDAFSPPYYYPDDPYYR